MTTERGTILQALLCGGPLRGLDIVDCHSHMGPALYQHVPEHDADGLVSVLDGLGVTTACVSHGVAMVSDWKLGNSLLIDAVRKYPDRIWGYTFFNPRYPADMAGELDRCTAAGLTGLKVHPDFHNTPADDRLYDPLYERAEALGCPLLCHYGAGRGGRAGADLWRNVVRRFPKALYIMAHSLPNRQAVDMAVDFFASDEVYFCLANAFQPGVIEYAAQRLGAGRLLYGSDGGWGSMARRLGLVCACDLPDDDKRLILGRTMRGLMARGRAH